jgi:flavodoxin
MSKNTGRTDSKEVAAMKTPVIYDSMHGNTEKIARAIGGAIPGEVKMLSVGEANLLDLESVDFLIIGSPTQGFRATKPIQALIEGLPDSALKGKKVAAEDS